MTSCSQQSKQQQRHALEWLAVSAEVGTSCGTNNRVAGSRRPVSAGPAPTGQTSSYSRASAGYLQPNAPSSDQLLAQLRKALASPLLPSSSGGLPTTTEYRRHFSRQGTRPGSSLALHPDTSALVQHNGTSAQARTAVCSRPATAAQAAAKQPQPATTYIVGPRACTPYKPGSIVVPVPTQPLSQANTSKQTHITRSSSPARSKLQARPQSAASGPNTVSVDTSPITHSLATPMRVLPPCCQSPAVQLDSTRPDSSARHRPTSARSITQATHTPSHAAAFVNSMGHRQSTSRACLPRSIPSSAGYGGAPGFGESFQDKRATLCSIEGPDQQLPSVSDNNSDSCNNQHNNNSDNNSIEPCQQRVAAGHDLAGAVQSLQGDATLPSTPCTGVRPDTAASHAWSTVAQAVLPIQDAQLQRHTTSSAHPTLKSLSRYQAAGPLCSRAQLQLLLDECCEASQQLPLKGMAEQLHDINVGDDETASIDIVTWDPPFGLKNCAPAVKKTRAAEVLACKAAGPGQQHSSSHTTSVSAKKQLGKCDQFATKASCATSAFDQNTAYIRQAAPMVLSLDNLLDSTPEVLELELEHMTFQQLQAVNSALGQRTPCQKTGH